MFFTILYDVYIRNVLYVWMNVYMFVFLYARVYFISIYLHVYTSLSKYNDVVCLWHICVACVDSSSDGSFEKSFHEKTQKCLTKMCIHLAIEDAISRQVTCYYIYIYKCRIWTINIDRCYTHQCHYRPVIRKGYTQINKFNAILINKFNSIRSKIN